MALGWRMMIAMAPNNLQLVAPLSLLSSFSLFVHAGQYVELKLQDPPLGEKAIISNSCRQRSVSLLRNAQ